MTIEKLKALVATGEKATQGEWEISDIDGRIQCSNRGEEICHPLTAPEKRTIESADNTIFITLSANIHKDLPAIIAKYERMEEALRDIVEQSHEDFETSASKAKQALED